MSTENTEKDLKKGKPKKDKSDKKKKWKEDPFDIDLDKMRFVSHRKNKEDSDKD